MANNVKVDRATIGDVVLGQARPTQRAVVRSAVLTFVEGTQTVSVFSGATDLSGPMNRAFVLPHNDDKDGWFSSGINQELKLTLGAAVRVTGTVSVDYVK